jgi:hypothetical protein
MNAPDHIFESLETIFWVKILKFFDADPDPGSGNLIDPGSGMKKIRIWDKHTGSATLYSGRDFYNSREDKRENFKKLNQKKTYGQCCQ